jgi:hypothetical protein
MEKIRSVKMDREDDPRQGGSADRTFERDRQRPVDFGKNETDQSEEKDDGRMVPERTG